jgi:adhesin transport system membrane fusion protein
MLKDLSHTGSVPPPSLGPSAARSTLWIIAALVAAFLVWADQAVLDEVAVGNGTVVPSSRSQIVQTLEGGLLVELLKKEGDSVEAGEKIASLDPLTARASADEAAAKVAGLMARAARLQALVDGQAQVAFPDELADFPEVVAREEQLFAAERQAYQTNRANLMQEKALLEQELELYAPLLATRAVSQLEIVRIEQKVAEVESRISALDNDFKVRARDQYSTTMGELEPLLKVRNARTELLRRTEILSPAKGIVKDVEVTTIGGVIPPGGTLMYIVPSDDLLLIEAKINPRDIAFLHQGQAATVKVTAYDSAIYGTLTGVVDQISPDTIESEDEPGVYYYRVWVLTERSDLSGPDGRRFPIIPGMVTTTEIRIGQKTVMDYLVKPLNRAAEALRER